jgi:hypothetical protein
MDKRSDVYAPEGLQKIEGTPHLFGWLRLVGRVSIIRCSFVCIHDHEIQIDHLYLMYVHPIWINHHSNRINIWIDGDLLKCNKESIDFQIMIWTMCWIFSCTLWVHNAIFLGGGKDLVGITNSRTNCSWIRPNIVNYLFNPFSVFLKYSNLATNDLVKISLRSISRLNMRNHNWCYMRLCQ